MARKLVYLCLFFMLPTAAIAASVFGVSGTDSSMQYLGAVFGGMGTLPVGTDGSPLFSEMIQIMNKIIFFLGIIIILYTGTVSTIQTAQEGEVLGKKWSTFWVPVRAALGLFLLVPSPGSGYSYIQIGVMYLIVQGVGAANAIWERVLYHIALGQSLADTVTPSVPGGETGTIINNFLASELCAYHVNNTEALSENVEFEPIVFFQSESDPNIMKWGVEATDTAYCGQVGVPDLVSAVPSSFGPERRTAETLAPLQNIHRNMMLNLSFSFSPMAEEALSDPDSPSNWTTPANLTLVARTVKNSFVDIENYYNSVRNDVSTVLDVARIKGWIHAGDFYSRLVKNQAEAGAGRTYPPSGYQPPNYEAVAGSETDGNNLKAYLNRAQSNIMTQAADMIGRAPSRTQMAGGSPPGGGYGHLDPIANAMKDLAMNIISSMTSNPGESGVRDPLVPISKAGLKIMEVIEITFWVLVVAIPLLAIASVPPCINPIWGVIATVGIIVMTLFMILGPMLWTAGVILGLYAPLIPFLVYTFSAIAWIILVIEAIVAAPLIALVLVVPSEDEMGKAGHSLVILLGLIFRPALMVLGFILGAKVMFVTMGMIDFGFREYVIANLTGIGIFGAVAIIIIYCGVVITVIHQSFSLIYSIPDKVLRWMGGQPETQDVSSKVKQIRGSAEKGASAGGGMMKGGVGAVSKAGK